MKSELLESEGTGKAQEQRQVEIDWTESEWFAVWLRLARGEYQEEEAEMAS